jgi:hypothetical protein
MKTPLFIAAILSCAMAIGQEVSFPMENNSIHYNNVVITSNNTTPESITEKVNQWINQNTRQYRFERQSTANIGNLISVKGKVPVDPDKRNQHNVECEFTMDISIIDGRYRYEIYGFSFLKADQKFNASDVYKGYISKDPLVKTAFESKDAAVERHGQLLERLQQKMTTMIGSLERTVDQ